MGGNDLSALSRRMDKILKEALSGDEQRKIAGAVGQMAKRQVSMSGRASLGGDYAFSGWKKRDGSLMPLEAAYSLGRTPGVVVVHRSARSAGPWRVAEEGRNRGGSTGLAGPGITKNGQTLRKKNGQVRSVRARKARRWNGTTSGFGSWSSFESIVLPKVMPVVAKEVRSALSRAVAG